MAGLGLHGYFPVAPRVRYEVDFDAPLFFGQDVCTVVEPVRVGTSSMTFAFEVWGEEFRGRPRGRAAHGRYVTVHVGGDHREGAASAPWPAEWVAALTRAGPAVGCPSGILTGMSTIKGDRPTAAGRRSRTVARELPRRHRPQDGQLDAHRRHSRTADRAGLDAPSVRTAVFRLKKRGWLESESPRGGCAVTH
ncbi:hotdog domain-containing protein [Streptomyces stelliscabiei]